MFLYLLVIAITNLSLGYFLGAWHVRIRRAAAINPSDSRAVNKADESPSTEKPNDSYPAATQPLVEGAKVVATQMRADAVGLNNRPRTSETPATWSTAEVWTDIRDKLKTARERIRYARSAGDKRLAQDAAAQLQNWARSWCGQAQQCLDEALSATSGEQPIDGVDSAQLEMFTAQLEATITNVAFIDWSETIESVTSVLDRETDLLEKNQRLLSLNAV